MPFLTSFKDSNIIMSDVLYHAKTTRLESITNGGECRESDELIISSGWSQNADSKRILDKLDT